MNMSECCVHTWGLCSIRCKTQHLIFFFFEKGSNLKNMPRDLAFFFHYSSHIFQCKNAFHVNASKASLRTTVCGLTLIIIVGCCQEGQDL